MYAHNTSPNLHTSTQKMGVCSSSETKHLDNRRKKLQQSQRKGGKAIKKHHGKSMAQRKNLKLHLVESITEDHSKQEEFNERQAKAQLRDMRKADGEGPANFKKDCIKIRLIGRGAGGSVYLGIYVPTLTLVAIKEVSVGGMQEIRERMRVARGDSAISTRASTSEAIRELHALHKNLVPISTGESAWLFHYHENIGDVHPCHHIVSFYGAYAERDNLRLEMVMELMDSGSLQVQHYVLNCCNAHFRKKELVMLHCITSSFFLLCFLLTCAGCGQSRRCSVRMRAKACHILLPTRTAAHAQAQTAAS